MAKEHAQTNRGQREALHPVWEKALEEHREVTGHPERLGEAKESLRERVRQEVRRVPPARAPAQKPPQQLPAHPNVRDIAVMPEARQVIALAQIALSEGIEPAVQLARDIGSAYVLDALHDVLVDKLFEELVKRGKLHAS